MLQNPKKCETRYLVSYWLTENESLAGTMQLEFTQ